MNIQLFIKIKSAIFNMGVLLCLVLFFYGLGLEIPSNDDQNTAIEIPNLEYWSSELQEFSNINGINSGASSGCGEMSNDT